MKRLLLLIALLVSPSASSYAESVLPYIPPIPITNDSRPVISAPVPAQNATKTMNGETGTPVPLPEPEVILQGPINWDNLYKKACMETGFIRTPNVKQDKRQLFCECVFTNVQTSKIWGSVTDIDLSRGLKVFKGILIERRQALASGEVANPRNIKNEKFASMMADMSQTSVAILANEPHTFICMGAPAP